MAHKITQGDLGAAGRKFAIVAGRFNSFITDRLLAGALDALTRSGCTEENIEIVRIPGSWELPVVVAELVRQKRHDAIIALGAVIRGDTAPIAIGRRTNIQDNCTLHTDADAPLTIVLLLEFGDTFGYYFDDVVTPAAGFINSLRPDDWAALTAYDIRPEILVDFTKNKSELFNGLRRLRIPAYRETCLYDAVWDTLDRLDNVDGKKAH